jgi:chromate transporter
MPSLTQIGSVFARYANLTLGGGSATTAVIRGEIVGKRRWVSEEQFALSFALGRLTPGTNLLAFCVGIGWILRKWSCAVVALLAASIPCTLIVVAITVLFSNWQENPYVQSAIRGAVAAAVAITVKTVWTITHPHYKRGNRLRVALIGATAFALHAIVGLSPIDVLLIAAVCWLRSAGAAAMNIVLLYLLLLKGTVTAFAGLASLAVIQDSLVTQYHVLTNDQLNDAVVVTRSSPGPVGLYIVSVGYFVVGLPGAVAAGLR